MYSRILFKGTAAAVAARRIRHILGPVMSKEGWNCSAHEVKLLNTSSGDTVKIGEISYRLKTPRNPELVPVNHMIEALPQMITQHLRWIMQKDLLGQDVFLIGPPGPLRRSIAMQYLELTKREVEYVALSRDTTETDLKQRREIRSGTAFYIDQCAVRAATEGRILVLEGLEKAERNVLPVLNNLLENREMQLEDGRFLMSAQRYDKLLEEHTKEEMEAWKIVRVSEDFRVIALGLPVPRYKGNPLDPPLRSRFQARDIYYLPFKDQLEHLYTIGPNVPPERVSQLLSFATTLCSQESASLNLPDFPVDNLPSALTVLNRFPMLSVQQLVQRLYPYQAMLGKEGHTAVEGVLSRFELTDESTKPSPTAVVNVEILSGDHAEKAAVTLNIGNQNITFQVPSGTRPIRPPNSSPSFIGTPTHDRLLAEMMQSHLVKDMCLIGAKGCGKSMIAREFAEMLGYSIEPIMLYQDMTARDLLQQRYTLPNGDTAWRASPLVTAAQEGKLLLLDGIHRVNLGTLAVLSRLLHDRELALYDGTRLLRWDRYQTLKEELKLTDQELQDRSIFPIHPSFRIIALAEPPQVGSATQQWLGPEILTMFLFHTIKPLAKAEETAILQGMIPNVPKEAVEQLQHLTHSLRKSNDPTALSLASSLSTRQLLRICRRLSQYPQESVAHAVNKACLSRFLPSLARSSLQKSLMNCSIEDQPDPASEQNHLYTCTVKDGLLTIGNISAPVYSPDEKMKVPDVLFYENVQHMMVMQDMLKDFLLGEHLLLVGNQGVGKNKIVDRFLHLMNRPREYLQLHRDTTVQTLTLQPSVRDGVIIYEDSPLVKAVKMGHILVIDEADKAPTNVTCILKTLVESGEMILADGRRIVSDPLEAAGRPNAIPMHPDFRMIVLANRPGFPFLGNDFFGALGDIFSCHAVDNPKPQAEFAMLKQYGPGVPDAVLQKLVAAFGELRAMADQGTITYPYSTREVVNIVKHLQKFPDEGLANVVRNVFDFDSYNKDTREVLITALHKHGIPIGAKPTSVYLAKELPLPDCKMAGYWAINRDGNTRRKLLCPTESHRIDIKGPVFLRVQSYPFERHETRSMSFTEEQAHWQIPMNEVNIICDVTTANDSIYVATCNPVSLYAMKERGDSVQCVELYDIFPRTISGVWQPFVSVAALGNPLQDQVVLHEEQGNTVLHVDLVTGAVRRLVLSQDKQEEPQRKTSNWWSNKESQPGYKMCKEFAHKNWLLFYKENGNQLDVVDVLEGQVHTISLPINLKAVFLVAEDRWLLVESKTDRKFLLTKPMHMGAEDTGVCQLHAISEDAVSTGFGTSSGMESTAPQEVSNEQLPNENLSTALGQKIASPNRILCDTNTYANVIVGFPDLMSPNEVYSFKRHSPITEGRGSDMFFGSNKRTGPAKRVNCVCLLDANQVIRALPPTQVPLTEVYPKDVTPPMAAAYLEVTDLNSKKLKYIPVPRSSSMSPYTVWISKISDTDVVMAPLGSGGVVTVDMGGYVRVWETGLDNLQRSLLEWRKMIGSEDSRPIQITIQRDSGLDVSSPKHGKIDPKNAPHVGGNQWAGGTGGRDTAGLGGKGGPYRLDAGHKVYQISQAEKDAVPDEVKRAAREMGEKAFKQRLKEIEMSEYDATTYDRFSGAVRRQVQSLRIILDSLQAKGKERQWLRNQALGELDDAKIIDGLTGEKAIYKRRGELEPELGSPQQKPKRLRLLADVSGSMYRFNGVDGRLERSMEAVCMVMEALESYEHKFKYDIMGHSGDGFDIELVRCDKVPKNNKERLKVLKNMHAHSQFCMSGDYTLEGTEHAVKELAREEADEHFVIVLSDANLERYGISPDRFARALTSDPKVNAFAIFIGSLGDQADRLQRTLPAGRSFVAMDTKQIPQILQQIFTSTMLSSA
ncbi:von Willebrand factor A domain-containing protein 8 [Pimephales promelas]|uniref:von Willebrand factor A domain-containing protein 8 n=1 Tax=Pimephales promelas TaxID=90988 RepID=UPI001955CD5B|nr:von Willebrand factor A domain-containing protein 8 [Pimephales promelas]KAG1945294.1 VWFA domain-containing protein [Pimephales promelas]